MSAPRSAQPAHPVLDAVRAGDLERASLRLLYGLLVALDETAPAAREELLHLMVERRLAAHRGPHPRVRRDAHREGGRQPGRDGLGWDGGIR